MTCNSGSPTAKTFSKRASSVPWSSSARSVSAGSCRSVPTTDTTLRVPRSETRRISNCRPRASMRSVPAKRMGARRPVAKLDSEGIKAVEHAAEKSKESRLAGLVGAVKHAQPSTGKGNRQLFPNAEPFDLQRRDSHRETPSAAWKSFIPCRAAWEAIDSASNSGSSDSRRDDQSVSVAATSERQAANGVLASRRQAARAWEKSEASGSPCRGCPGRRRRHESRSYE